MRVRITGKRPLNGTYHASGSSNAAQALIAAALLTESPVTLHHAPRTTSVQAMIDAGARLGASIAWDGDTLTIDGAQFTRRTLSQEESELAVGGMLLLAPMLTRRQVARVEIDAPLSRVRTHLDALRDLGQDVTTQPGAVEVRAASWERRDLTLTQASVTATAMTLMLAARLGIETVIRNAACEPHVTALAHTLNAMGAHVDGIESNVLRVMGAPVLNGTAIDVPPDHIEAASLAAIAALCGGRVQIDNARAADLSAIARGYQRLGITLDMDENAVYVPRHGLLEVSDREEDIDGTIETAPWPGFPSDLVGVVTVAASQARGTLLIHEKMFNNRLLFVDKLKAMGAPIVLCDPHRAIVMGAAPLHGIYLDSPDVRTGLGLIAAALCAEGETVIDNARAVDYQFAGVYDKLIGLGASITVEQA